MKQIEPARKVLEQSKNPKPERARVLEKKIIYSRLALLIERIWPRLWLPIGTIGVFVLVSLTGIWPDLPAWVHKLALAIFGLLFIISLFPALMSRWPTRAEALKRLERVSGLKHQPVSSYEDSLGTKNPSRATLRLWQAHRERISETFLNLKSGHPHPRVDKMDPFALRALLMIILTVSLLATGNLVTERITSAFKLNGNANPSTIRLDAWITPPAYTGKAPIILSDGSQQRNETDDEKRFIKVPENSKLVIRLNSSSPRSYNVLYNQGSKENSYAPLKPQNQNKPTDTEDGIAHYQIALKKPLGIKIRNGLQDIYAWQFFIQKDLPPKIRLIQPVRTTARNAIQLRYHLSDDYGVTSAKATFTRPDTVLDSSKDPDAPLGKAPEFTLLVPRENSETVVGNTYKDLTSHPWAGLETILILSAKDEAGQETGTKPVRTTLPSRKFTKQLAKALIEQRRKLVSKPKSNYLTVMRSLNALTISPENFINDLKVYLGIRSAYWRMRYKIKINKPVVHGEDLEKIGYTVSRETAKSVVDQLWELALYIEDGNLSAAERQMKLAQEKLAKALRDGASGEEIRKQLRELRTAISRFMQSLAQKQQNQKNQKITPGTGNRQFISAKDLDRMMRQIEELAKSGSHKLAAQMLAQLREILENLQTDTAQTNRSSQQMMSAMEDLSNLISRQQQLLDETFGEKQKANKSVGNPSQGDQNGAGDLAKRQGALQNMLGELIQGMRNKGMSPGQSLDQAGKAMGEAGQSLGQENLGRATQQQTLALDKLRKGARSLARRLMQQLGRQAGLQPGRRDPLGRRMPPLGPDFGNERVKVPDKIDVQRAREILRELRERFSDTHRPPVELDYLERLLQRF